MRSDICRVRSRAWVRTLIVVLALLTAAVTPAHAQTTSGSAATAKEIGRLREELELLRRRDEETRARMTALESAINRLAGTQDQAVTSPATQAGAASSPAEALDRALADSAKPSVPTSAPAAGAARSDLWSTSIGGGAAQARLIDISLATLVAAGASSVGNSALELLQGGAHDPDRNGFTLQQAELSLTGAVDPYFSGEAHLVATPGGVELEEAFLTTISLPWRLQVEAGYSLTEFGIINPAHPHAWDWLDQPVVNTRLFGGDGLRSPGARAAWLLPLPWFAELHLGVQNANEGEYTVSFVGEEGVGGRPNTAHDVRALGDLLWLLRANAAWDLGDSAALLLGGSALHGPNSSGPDGETWIYGADAKLRWRPASNFRGWPFVVWQAEFAQRDFEADAFAAGSDVDPSSSEFPNDLPGDTLHDRGVYTQLLYGFRYRWAVGLRAEYASGSGRSIDGGVLAPRSGDPLRDDRVRLSPLLVWHPSEFSRLRLQYNYDDAEHLKGGDAHTVWIGAEVLYGKHPAHKY